MIKPSVDLRNRVTMYHYGVKFECIDKYHCTWKTIEQRWFVKLRIYFQVGGEKGGLWPEYPKIGIVKTNTNVYYCNIILDITDNYIKLYKFWFMNFNFNII